MGTDREITISAALVTMCAEQIEAAERRRAAHKLGYPATSGMKLVAVSHLYAALDSFANDGKDVTNSSLVASLADIMLCWTVIHYG